MTKDEALKLALQYVQPHAEIEGVLVRDVVKAALAQPEQEPVSTKVSQCLAVLRPAVKGKFPQEQALEELAGYTSPPPRQPLTNDDIETIIRTKHFRPGYVKCNSDLVILDWYRLGLRDGEAAHAIGEKA